MHIKLWIRILIKIVIFGYEGEKNSRTKICNPFNFRNLCNSAKFPSWPISSPVKLLKELYSEQPNHLPLSLSFDLYFSVSLTSSLLLAVLSHYPKKYIALHQISARYSRPLFSSHSLLLDCNVLLIIKLSLSLSTYFSFSTCSPSLLSSLACQTTTRNVLHSRINS